MYNQKSISSKILNILIFFNMLKQKLKSFKIKKSLIYANRTCFARRSSCQKTINLDQLLKLINVRLIFLKKKLLSLYRPLGFWNFSILRDRDKFCVFSGNSVNFYCCQATEC